MHYFQLLVLSILIVSCHKPEASDMEQYQSSKKLNNQDRSSEFDKTVADFIQEQKQGDLNSLYKLSEKTFVEETDSLKAKGAGAGLTDND